MCDAMRCVNDARRQHSVVVTRGQVLELQLLVPAANTPDHSNDGLMCDFGNYPLLGISEGGAGHSVLLPFITDYVSVPLRDINTS